MQSNPIADFRAWFVQQPDDIQDALSLFVLTKIPRLQKSELNILSDAKKTFMEYLDEIPQKASAIIGETLLIRSLIDFSVIRHFGSSDDWEQKKDFQEGLANHLESEHGPNPMTNQIREQLKSFPERRALWLKSAGSWRILKNTSLSDEFLEAWERNNAPRVG